MPACPQDQTAKECGLHSGNIVQSAEAQAAGEQADLWASGPVEALDHAALEKLADGQRDKDTLVVLYAPWCQYSQVNTASAHLPFRVLPWLIAYDCNQCGIKGAAATRTNMFMQQGLLSSVRMYHLRHCLGPLS